MKKLTFNMRFLVGIGVALLAMACAQDGMTDETFKRDTTNTQVKSLTEQDITIGTQLNGTTEVLAVSWPVVLGAKGYDVLAKIVTDPENPAEIYKAEALDRLSFTVPAYDATRYEFHILPRGDESLNNTDAAQEVSLTYFYGVEGELLPESEDVGSYINNYMAAHAAEFAAARAEDPDFEVAFDLAVGGEYTMAEALDFGLQAVRVRGLVLPDDDTHPTLTLTDDAKFVTQAGLRLVNLNLDCSESTSKALIACSQEPDASISLEALGYKAAGASFDGYLIEKPVVIENCMVKNLPAALLNSQSTPWSLREVRVLNSIIQLNNDGTALFEFNGSSNCLIKELLINGCTLYSTKDINANFINYPRQLDANQIYGTDATASVRFEDSTFAKFSKKQMGNNSKDTKTNIHYITNCIFYDCFRLYQIFGRNNGVRNVENNILYYNVVSVDSNDTPRFGEVEDPGFSEPFGDIDFSLPNGGLNFTPTSGTLAPKIGDPRWR